MFGHCDTLNHRKNSNSISCLSCHFVWAIKYRYHFLSDDIQYRCRGLLVQMGNAENVQILKALVSKDHIQM